MKDFFPKWFGKAVLGAAFAVVLFLALSRGVEEWGRTPRLDRLATGGKSTAEGRLIALRTITPEIFEINRRYRSMEGPYQRVEVAINQSPDWAVAVPRSPDQPQQRELVWWKGVSIEVIDAETEKNAGPEFMCHLNLDIDKGRHAQAFPGWQAATERMVTLTQGEMHFELPEGYGVPMASDDGMIALFQVLNHNRDGNFRVRQRMTLYFIRDRDLHRPLQAVSWSIPYVILPTDGNLPAGASSDQKLCPCCMKMPAVLNAPNNTLSGLWDDANGRRLSGHWQVPPGKNEWRTPVALTEPTFPRSGSRLVATWSHVHPFCEQLRLLYLDPRCGEVEIVRNTVRSLGGGKVGLKSIHSYQSPVGLELAPGAYEVSVTYNNTGDKPQDSMATLGLFFTDPTFSRPDWASRSDNVHLEAVSCAVPLPEAAETAK
jgi:hypothetical protein